MVVLPKAPRSDEKFLYADPRRVTLYTMGLISVIFLLTGMWLFIFAHPTFAVFAVYAAVMSIYLSISYLIGVLGRDFDFRRHEAQAARNYDTDFGSVDVYLPVCGEPLEVLNNTWGYVRDLRYKNRKVYVLDDAADPAVQFLAQQKFGFEYISRPNRGELKKAGNLRHAFTQTSGDFFVVFDADFCPHPDFLNELLPYMKRDPRVAIVQSPQFFSVLEEQTWVEKGAGYIQELFYRLVQVSRDSFDASICVGSNAIYRREALKPFGGTAAIAYSEDVHTGFMVTDAGWKVRYVPVCLARGMCPHDLKSFFLQQYRWATGSITLFFNKEFWTSSLTIMQKICYLSGMLFYISSGLGVFMIFVPSLVMVWRFPELVFWYNVIFSVPSFLYGFIVVPLWTTHKFGMYAPRTRQVAYYAYLFALIDKLKGDLVAWQPSGNVGKVKRFLHFRKLMFYWVCFAAAAILVGAGRHLDRWQDFAPTTFFTCFNAWIHLTVLRDQGEA